MQVKDKLREVLLKSKCKYSQAIERCEFERAGVIKNMILAHLSSLEAEYPGICTEFKNMPEHDMCECLDADHKEHN